MKVTSINYVNLCFICLLLLSVSVVAQDKSWRPIAPNELALSKPTVEPDADAEAIFWETYIDNSKDDGFTRRHYVRVKIFTERGRERYSKFDIPFYRGLKIKDLAARVIKPDGTSVEIGKADIFEREIVRASGIKVKAKSFAVPSIEPGVIIEYRYKESYDDGGAVGMRLDFQRDIPVQNLSYYYKPYEKKEPKTQAYNFSDTKFVKGEDGYYLAQRRNVPAFREEPRMPPEKMVKPWMMLTGLESSFSFTGSGISIITKDPSNPSKYWGGVGAERVRYVKAMIEIAKEVKKTTEQVIAGATTDDEKIRKIYAFCQTNIKNTSYDATLTDESRKKLPEFKSYSDMIKRGSGTYFQINMLFGAMAIAAGIEARYVLAGNRSDMFFEPKMTNDDLVAFAGIGIKSGNDYKLLNPGIKYAPYGVVPWYFEDSWALFVGSENFTWQQTNYTPHENTNVKRTAKLNLLDDGTLEGDVTVELSGHRALSYRLEYYDETADKREASLKDDVKRRISQAEVSALSIENIEDTAKPIVQRYKIRVPNYAQKTGKRFFIQPGFFEYGESPLFASADRKFDIFFSYPWSETDNVELKFPTGFAVDNGDSPGVVADNNKIVSDSVSIRVDGANSTILYDRKFHFGGGGKVLFKPENYTALKGLWDAINKADTHQISLKQK